MNINKSYISKSVDDTIKFAYQIAKILKKRDILCLDGELGTGKTVIAKEICKFFLVNDDVISPTFNILKIYKTKNKDIKLIYHFDLYRIKSISELYNIGFEEYVYSDNAITIIEWPEIAMDFFLNGYKKINIDFVKQSIDKRIFSYEHIN